jgi:tetratricopeptide (TPR) repeat protein
VFSIEEASFHVWQNWRETFEDIKGKAFAEWAAETLKMPDLAKRLRERASAGVSEAVTSFLRDAGILTSQETDLVMSDITAWEKRENWERLKERGDYFMIKKSPARALGFYRQALNEERSVVLLNNTAVALMNLGDFSHARDLLAEARESDKLNEDIALHYAEACVYCGDFDTVDDLLSGVPSTAKSLLVRAALFESQGRNDRAEKYYKEAAKDGTEATSLKLADFYIRHVMYDQAENALEHVNSFAAADERRADILRAQGKPREAAQLIELALRNNSGNTSLWQKLAEVNLEANAHSRAFESASRALSIEPANLPARLLLIKARRAMSRSRDYLDELQALIATLKNDYRESPDETVVV